VSFVRDHGCSIETPLNHQSKSKAGAGIGSEWLAGGGNGPVTITAGAGEGSYEMRCPEPLVFGQLVPLG
jgi:hypothetical protein